MIRVNLEKPTKLDLIHARRMLHAFAQCLGRLLLVDDVRVQAILNAWSITLFPDFVVGIEYHPGVKQILEFELNQEKAAIAGAEASKKLKEAPKKSKVKAKR